MKEINRWENIDEFELSSLCRAIKSTIEAPALIFLEGLVGAGKTTFTRSFVNNLDAPSPTYSILNEIEEYLHADFYRIEERSEIMHLEIPLYLEDKNYFLVEWGIPYKELLIREVGMDFKTYKLDIVVPSPVSSHNTSKRTFILSEL